VRAFRGGLEVVTLLKLLTIWVFLLVIVVSEELLVIGETLVGLRAEKVGLSWQERSAQLEEGLLQHL
jgi:hypothetical protein